MSVYDPLKIMLSGLPVTTLVLSFAEIEKVINRPLPRSAYDYNAWWSNDDSGKTTHSQSKAWTMAGFNAEADRTRRVVTFRRR